MRMGRKHMDSYRRVSYGIFLLGGVEAHTNLIINTAISRGSGGMPPLPRKFINLRALRLHFRPILTEISVDKVDLLFLITLCLALYKILLVGETWS